MFQQRNINVNTKGDNAIITKTHNHVPLSAHAPDIPQVTDGAIKTGLKGQAMCHHMYLWLPGVSFLSCEWGGDGNHSAHRVSIFPFLKNPHKLSQRCCGMKLLLVSPLPSLPHLIPVTFLLPPPHFTTPLSFSLIPHPRSPSVSHLLTCSCNHADPCQRG